MSFPLAAADQVRGGFFIGNGAPDRNRTCDLQLRKAISGFLSKSI